jgi:hypothetical protein
MLAGILGALATVEVAWPGQGGGAMGKAATAMATVAGTGEGKKVAPWAS